MFLCDYHTHTRFSFDGDPASTHDAMCRRALEIGLDHIAFTDHFDVNAEVEGLYDAPYDADAAFASMMEVKEKYKGRLNVLCGLELGNAPQYPAEAKAALEGSDIPALPPLSHRIDTALRQVELAVEDKGEHVAILEARKQLCWYLKGVSHANYYKEQIVRMNTLDDARRISEGIKRDLV